MKNFEFELQLLEAILKYPSLKIAEVESEKYLKGNLDIIDSSGCIWDTYSIEIKGSNEFPYRFPLLMETENAFLKINSWHVNNDGTCCLDVPQNEMLICKNGISVIDFIKGHVIPYLANQTFRRREGYYLYGEYSHGIVGRVEFYQNKLKAKTPAELISMLYLITNGYHPDRTSYCPFCFKSKFRHCHKDAFNELEKIKDFIVIDAISQLIPFFETYPKYQLPKAG